VKDKMQEKEKFSDDCAQCFGDISGCTAYNCMWQCLRGGTACGDCVAKQCTPAFEECTGLFK
jgi:hypothetical protein